MSEYKLPQSRSHVKRELISIFTSWVDNRFGEDDVDSCWFNLMSSDLVTLHKDLIEKIMIGYGNEDWIYTLKYYLGKM